MSSTNNVKSMDVPPGYTIGTLADGQQFLVPNFMVLATDLALKTQDKCNSVAILEASHGVSDHPLIRFYHILLTFLPTVLPTILPILHLFADCNSLIVYFIHSHYVKITSHKVSLLQEMWRLQ